MRLELGMTHQSLRKPSGPVVSFVWLLCCGLLSGASGQQTQAPPTAAELLNILRITTFRVYAPEAVNYVWDIKMLRKTQLLPSGPKPLGLTKYTGLLSFRDVGDRVYEFTLPERQGRYSQGKFDICKGIECGGQTSIHWLKQPRYSANGSQCVLAEFTSDIGDKPDAYLTLVSTKSY
jgi:hypothetical protein